MDVGEVIGSGCFGVFFKLVRILVVCCGVKGGGCLFSILILCDSLRMFLDCL